MKGLNRIELVVGGILVSIFLIWSYDTCSSSNQKYQRQQPAQQEEPAPQADNNTNNNNQNSNNNNTNTSNNNANNPTTVQPQPTQPPVQAVPNIITIYISTEKLNMRNKPFLTGSQVIEELPRGTELFYLNNKSEYKDKITIDGVLYDEPWLEVQTKAGKKGWIFAGGVRFYK